MKDNVEYTRYAISIWSYKFRGAGDGKLIYTSRGFYLRGVAKWLWYFEYLAALEKIKTPKRRIQVETISYTQLPENEIQLKNQKNKVKALKSGVTKTKNLLKKHVESGLDMFPDYNPKYQKAINKLEYQEKQLQEHQLKLEKLLKNQNKRL